MFKMNADRRDHRGERLRIVRRRPDTVVSVVVTVGAMLVSGLTLSTARVNHWQPSGIAFAIGVWIFAWLVWNLGVRSRVGVWSGGLGVVNGFVHHWLPWSSIAVADSAVDVVLRLKDGSRVRPLSLMGSPAGAIIFGGRHQRNAAGSLEAERENRAGDEDEPRTRHYELRLVSLLVITAAVVGLGFIPTN
jgi:hypothetical protein